MTREEAIFTLQEAVDDAIGAGIEIITRDGGEAIEMAIEALQERKTGKWKYNTAHGYYGCTNCNHRLGFGAVLDMGGLPCACPWCDAKMEVDNAE